MTEHVTSELNKQDPSPFHQAMLTHALSLVKMSRSKMSKYYKDWDMQDQVFHGERMVDRDDVEQELAGKPVKMVVPNTFAQTMTFTSFLFLMFNQNRTFFELQPTGNEDYGKKHEDAEKMLERDLRHNSWNRLLFQHLLDIGRFGPSIFECCWTREMSHAYITPEPTMATFNNVQVNVRGGSEWQEFVKYEGNLVRVIEPYRFFPDTRFPLTDFQKGEFCAAEEEYSKASLRKLQAAGEVAGVDFIQPLANNLDNFRGGPTRTSMTMDKADRWLMGPSKSEGTVLVTKMQVWIVPSKFKIDEKKTLGPEEFPILYHLWYANDNRVIRCEPAYWWHNQFGWSVGQFLPDMHNTLNLGLADLIYRLQDVITWFINSRITDVRRNIRGRLIVDPTGIDTESIDSDGDIYLRSSAGKTGIDRWIKPLNMQDVTSSHMQDADILSKLVQVVTGVNDNAMGQYNSGRRSAQEARVVTAGAAGRMKLHGHMIWDTAIGPLGRMMLSNSRQSISQDMFGRVIGTGDDMADRYAAFKGTPEEIVVGDDYFTFDSTLSSEKGFMAQSLQELLVAILQSDPVAAAQMAQGINPVKLVEEIQYLRGGGNLKRFGYTPQEQQQIAAEQKARFQAEHQPPPPKPPSMSLSGKMTPSQEEVAAAAAGIAGKRGEKPQPTGNGAAQ